MRHKKPLHHLGDWFDERFKVRGLLDHMKKKVVPVHAHSVWYYMGNILMTLLAVQFLTGMSLLYYYRPAPGLAYESVLSIIKDTDFGWLMRSIHGWTANLIIAAAATHLFSVFFLKGYRKPRELTWVSGMFMLFILLGFGFSGYLLPWNELSFFATKVGTDIAGQTPFVGAWVKLMLRGGDIVGADTLIRFYALHVVVLPSYLLVFAVFHIFCIQTQGMSVPLKIEPQKDKLKTRRFFPDFIMRDGAISCVTLAVIVVLAVLFPWELGRKADALMPTPAGIRPEWYFLFMFKTLEIIPAKIGMFTGSTMGILFFMAGFAFLVFVPFLDKRAARSQKGLLFSLIGVAIIIFFVGMTLWSVLSHGSHAVVFADGNGVDEWQLVNARKFIPELVVFLVTSLVLAITLWVKALDLEKLRDQNFN